MRVTIIRDDSAVGVDGVFRRVDLSSLRVNVRAVQWNGTSGHIEYDDTANTLLTDIAEFQSFIAEFQSFVDLWKAAASEQIASLTAPSPDQMKAAAMTGKRQRLQDMIAALGDFPTQQQLDDIK